jgi:hypothetical protein
MECDMKKYWHHLDEFDLTDDEKKELIKTLWQVCETCIDQAFGIDSVQLAQNASKSPSLKSLFAQESGDLLKSLHKPQNDKV